MAVWRKRHWYAEQAEALGLTTNHIISDSQNAQVVTYVHDEETNDPDEPLYAAVLMRAKDTGILMALVKEIPVGTVGQMADLAFEKLNDPPDDPGE